MEKENGSKISNELENDPSTDFMHKLQHLGVTESSLHKYRSFQ